MSKNSIIIIIVVIGLAFGGYIFFTKSASNTNSDNGLVADVSTSDMSSVKEAATILQTLNKINGITIDDSIFNTPAYRSLKASQVTINPQPVGRSNPFAPLGLSVFTSQDTQSGSAQTAAKKTSTTGPASQLAQ